MLGFNNLIGEAVVEQRNRGFEALRRGSVRAVAITSQTEHPSSDTNLSFRVYRLSVVGSVNWPGLWHLPAGAAFGTSRVACFRSSFYLGREKRFDLSRSNAGKR